MFMRRLISYLLIISFLVQSIVPAWATEHIEKIEQQSERLKYGAIPAFINVKATPGQTAACCCVYARDGEEVKILVGLRDDEDTYANPGGKSDQEDETLNQTTSREGGEETLKIYCPYPDSLNTFVGLYSLKEAPNKTLQPFLNYMFFVEQQYVPAKAFNERLANAEKLNLGKESQEYKLWRWVLAKDVFDAITNGQKKVKLSDAGGEEIILFDPLFQTLSTETGKNLLGHLAIHKRIPLASTSERPLLKNKIHWEGFPSVNFDLTLGCELPVFNTVISIKEQVEKFFLLTQMLSQNILPSMFWEGVSDRLVASFRTDIFNRYIRVNKEDGQLPDTPFIAMDQDAFARKAGIRLLKNSHGDVLEKSVVPQDEKRNRTLLGIAVAAKGAANLEVKSLFSEPQDLERKRKQYSALYDLDAQYFQKNAKDFNLKDPNIPSDWKVEDVLPPLKQEPSLTPTLSDLLLQLQLGEEYVHPEHPLDPQSRHKADVENLQKYHKKYNNDGELKRKSDPVPSDYERLADVFELERLHPGWRPIHHASAGGEVKVLWTASTVLRELLFLNPVPKGTLPGMRATDIYFYGHNTIAESLKKTGTADYENGNMNRRLCGNMCITSGLTTTHTSSNSFEYFCNAHSVQMPSIPKKYQEGTELLGMVGTSYLRLQSIYEQFYGVVSPLPNSSWTTVFVHPDALDPYAHPSHGGGSVFHVDQPTIKDRIGDNVPSANALYERAYKDLQAKLQNPSQPSSSVKLADSVAEIRMLLHWLLMGDPTKSKTISIDRFPLTEIQQKQFMHMLRTCTVYDVGHWLAAHTQVMPNSLEGGEQPAIKKLYALVHQGVTGLPVEETLSLESFKHLIKNGHAEGVRLFHDSYPDLLQQISFTPKELVQLAIASGDVPTLEVVLKTILNKPMTDIYSKEDILGMVIACMSENYLSPTQSYVLENFDLSQIDEKVRRAWGVKILANGSADSIEKFNKAVLPLTEDIIEEAVKSSSPTSWQGLTQWEGIEKKQLAAIFLKFLPATGNVVHSLTYALVTLIQDGLSYAEPLPKTGNPLLFSLPYLLEFLQDKQKQDLVTTLVNDADLLDYKNAEGVSLIPHMQMRYIEEGVPVKFSFYKYVVKKQIAEREANSKSIEYYAPYQEAVGKFDLDQLFLQPHAEWIKKLMEASKSNSFKKVQEVWRIVPDPMYLTYYKATDPLIYYLNVHRGVDAKHDNLLAGNYSRLLKSCLDKDNYHGIFFVIELACKQGFGLALYNELKSYDSLLTIQETLQKKILSAYQIMQLLDQPTQFQEALEAGQISQNELVKVSYAIKDQHVDLLEKALPILFKNPIELVTRTSDDGWGIFHWSLLSQPPLTKLLKSMFAYGGFFPLLSQLSEEKFYSFLHHSSEELLDWIYQECPKIFGFHDETRNFLKLSTGHTYFVNMDFYKANLNDLKSLYDDNGIPLIISPDSNIDFDFVMQLFQMDPTILQLQTQQGLPVVSLISHFCKADGQAYEDIKNLLTQLGISL